MKNKTVPTSNRKKLRKRYNRYTKHTCMTPHFPGLIQALPSENRGVKEAAWAQETPS